MESVGRCRSRMGHNHHGLSAAQPFSSRKAVIMLVFSWWQTSGHGNCPLWVVPVMFKRWHGLLNDQARYQLHGGMDSSSSSSRLSSSSSQMLQIMGQMSSASNAIWIGNLRQQRWDEQGRARQLWIIQYQWLLATTQKKVINITVEAGATLNLQM